ncbi:hypothetical protein JCM10914A_10980 [Paenibacillus sp. JCM 10914]|uniref:hypothetical protein n=1 Tax=Paenibacillus sp. JCM 10914 TaxID=1236974 RepID=UPI0003CC8F23|nr:hypothetical protein [Paenibacillus sp. JCM 10914]GAE08156.1 hypothetical protein JCM10914_4422 [Paenibacillus sp. JCM 10914]
MIKWELKEKFDKQDARFTELRSKHDGLVREAEQKVAELVAEKQQILIREFDGGDVTAERATITKEIETAEKAVQEAKSVRDAAFTYSTEKSREGRITALDLTMDWNNKVIPEIREKELKPIVERMEAARAAMYNALLDYYVLVDKYDSQRREVVELEQRDSDQCRRMSYAVHSIEQEYNLPLVTSADLTQIKRSRALPNGIERKPTEKGVK